MTARPCTWPLLGRFPLLRFSVRRRLAWVTDRIVTTLSLWKRVTYFVGRVDDTEALHVQEGQKIACSRSPHMMSWQESIGSSTVFHQVIARRLPGHCFDRILIVVLA